MQTLQLLHLPINYKLCALVFFSTLSSYNFHFLLGALYLNKKITSSFLLHQKLRLIFFFVGVIGVAFFLIPSQVNLVLVLVASLLTGLYSLPLVPVKLPGFIRKAGFVKTLLLAFTWTFVTALLPIHQAGIEVGNTLRLLLLFQRFLFMLILCLLFDCRDVATDKIIGLHSLATDIKPALVKWIIYTSFLSLCIVILLMHKNGLPLMDTVALICSTAICFVVYLYSLKIRGFIFYYFVVDGLMILSALLTGLVHFIYRL
jgi:hypothetical protein